MKRVCSLLSIAILFLGCTNVFPPKQFDDPTATIPATEIQLTKENSLWTIYDSDPNHLWNRTFGQFYRRTTKDGKEYGFDELDPLLWFDTTYLLHGESHQEALHVLDEFLTSHAERLIQDRLKRAMFQRDMWAVFDWRKGSFS